MTRKTSNTHFFDPSWFTSLLVNDLAPHRLQQCRTESGLFHPKLNRQWEREGETVGTLVSQARLLYLFSEAYRLTGENAYLNALEEGADFLLRHFRDTEKGGWFWSCDPQGNVLADHKSTYGHAFVIFALAHVYDVTKKETFLTAARQTSDTLHEQCLDSFGGLMQITTRDFQDSDQCRSQNPVMHLTEALLALGELGGDCNQLERARYWIDFLFSPLRPEETHALSEDYDLAWRPLGAEDNGRIVIGHLYEWGFLHFEADRLGIHEQSRAYADMCVKAGTRIGYDTENGGIYRAAAPGNGVISTYKGWWEQCETLRVLGLFAFAYEEDAWTPWLEQTAAFFRKHLVDDVYGGLYPGTDAEGTPSDTGKSTEWKLDYHAAAMCAALSRTTVN